MSVLPTLTSSPSGPDLRRPLRARCRRLPHGSAPRSQHVPARVRVHFRGTNSLPRARVGAPFPVSLDGAQKRSSRTRTPSFEGGFKGGFYVRGRGRGRDPPGSTAKIHWQRLWRERRSRPLFGRQLLRRTRLS